MTIVPFLRDGAFEPNDIQAMSLALEDVCKALHLPDGDHPARLVMAERIIALARKGERNPKVLRDRVLKEAGFADEDGAKPNGRLSAP